MADAILVIAWLVLAHVVADFVLQSGRIASAKSSHGSRALIGLAAHGLVVTLCVMPVGFAWAEPGWWFVLLTGLSHVLIDRTKVVLTRPGLTASVFVWYNNTAYPSEFFGRSEEHTSELQSPC